MPKMPWEYMSDIQSWKDALAMLPAASGLVIRNNSGTPNTNIDVDAVFAVLIADTAPGEDVSLTYLAKGVDVTVNTTTNGANGLDTGARANNTWYYFFIIWGAEESVACLASLSSTSPIMPANYTHKVRVGAGKTDSSGNFIRFIQCGNVVMYGANILLASGAAGSIVTPTYVAVSVSGHIPPTASRLLGLLRVLGSSANGAAMAAPNNNFGSIDTGSNFPRVSVAANGGSQYGVYISEFDFALESENIYWASSVPISSSNGALLVCRGYVDKVNAS